jgi:hypothetical protein
MVVVVVVEAQAIGSHTQMSIFILAIIQAATNTLNTRRQRSSTNANGNSSLSNLQQISTYGLNSNNSSDFDLDSRLS